MLLCKVIVGDYTIGSENYDTPPLKQNGEPYDSMVDNLDNPNLYVISKDYHAIWKVISTN